VDIVKYLVDTNIWLELLLEQERGDQAREFLKRVDSALLGLTEFSLYSIGVILTRLKEDKLYDKFLADMLDNQINLVRLSLAELRNTLEVRKQQHLDFDDAYQYAVAEKYDLVIVSFDKDFDKTPRGKTTPAEIQSD